MDFYLALVFLHVLGALSLFISMGVTVLALARMPRAGTAAEAGSWMGLFEKPAHPLGGLGVGMLLVTGVWMMAVRWGVQAWMITALAAVLAMGFGSSWLSLRAVEGLKAGLAEWQADDGSAWRRWATDPRLRASVWVQVGVLVGIIGLMTLKPALLGSLLTMALAVVLGVVLARSPVAGASVAAEGIAP